MAFPLDRETLVPPPWAELVTQLVCDAWETPEPDLRWFYGPAEGVCHFDAGFIGVVDDGTDEAVYTLLQELSHWLTGEEHTPQWAWVNGELVSAFEELPPDAPLSLPSVAVSGLRALRAAHPCLATGPPGSLRLCRQASECPRNL
jgi:hypothetical protein